jgi:hypothetical protein
MSAITQINKAFIGLKQWNWWFQNIIYDSENITFGWPVVQKCLECNLQEQFPFNSKRQRKMRLFHFSWEPG